MTESTATIVEEYLDVRNRVNETRGIVAPVPVDDVVDTIRSWYGRSIDPHVAEYLMTDAYDDLQYPYIFLPTPKP